VVPLHPQQPDRHAATVSTDAEAEEFRSFLDAHQISEENRVIRRIALRGAATEGIALARADLVPEVTITSDGVFWHPVGAEDDGYAGLPVRMHALLGCLRGAARDE
jgi:hypothetical protein